MKKGSATIHGRFGVKRGGLWGEPFKIPQKWELTSFHQITIIYMLSGTFVSL